MPVATDRAPAKRHLANLIGAFVATYADEIDRMLLQTASGQQSYAAVIAMDTWPDRSVEALAGILQLSHSGAVRLVDRLVEEGLAARTPGPDQRTLAVRLTAKGRALARRLRASRAEVLDGVVAALTQEERVTLHRLLQRVLRMGPRTRTEARHACRLCDHSVCRDAACPIGASVPEPA